MPDNIEQNVTSALIQIKDKWESGHNPSFENLSDCVLQTHHYTQTAAIRAVNQFATLRNWLIGCYIVEYEQKGKDRAQYGERLFKRLEEKVNCRGLNETLFRVSRSFYLEYPQIRELFDKGKRATASHESEKHAMPSHKFMTPPEKIVSYLSFSHIREIMTEKDPLGRFFYETECIRGCWSVKELRRQVDKDCVHRAGYRGKQLLVLLCLIGGINRTDHIRRLTSFASKPAGLLHRIYVEGNGQPSLLCPNSLLPDGAR